MRNARNSPWKTLSSDGSQLNVEDFLTFRMARLSNDLHLSLTKPLLERFNISLPGWRVIAVLSRGSMRFSDIVDGSGMDKSQVSRTVQELKTLGLVKTERLKRRRPHLTGLASPVAVAITAKGSEMYNAMLPEARQLQAELLRQLNQSERVALYSIIEKLSKTVGIGIANGDAE